MKRRAAAAWLIVGAMLAPCGHFIAADQPKPITLSVPARYADAPALPAPVRYPDGLLDLNAADSEALETLPGIGETLAERLIAARPYYYVEDLLSVRGIGEKRFEALKNLIAVYPKTPLGSDLNE